MNRLFREPLFQFLVLGAGIFLLYGTLQDGAQRAPDEIVVGSGHIERMSQTWRKTRMRPPTRAELEGLIRDHIREEVYYREALALGLDQDNAVIRRHLRQKMEFLSDDIAAQSDPDDAQLQSFLEDNPERFTQDPLLTMRHIYFSRDDRGDDAWTDAQAIADTLDATSDESSLGDPWLYPPSSGSVPLRNIASRFGSHFADSIALIEPGQWSGPVESGYGVHLVYVDERIDALVPPLADIRDDVLREWREDRRQEVSEQFYASLRERYTVVVERPEWFEGSFDIDDVEQR